MNIIIWLYILPAFLLIAFIWKLESDGALESYVAQMCYLMAMIPFFNVLIIVLFIIYCINRFRDEKKR